MSSIAFTMSQKTLLLIKKEQLEVAIRAKFAEARNIGRHKPGVKALTKTLRKVKKQLELYDR